MITAAFSMLRLKPNSKNTIQRLARERPLRTEIRMVVHMDNPLHFQLEQRTESRRRKITARFANW
jgi:hypothetical protein